MAVDRLVAGRCCGGIRASAGVTAEELRRIAEIMTLKCGFVGLAAGGAKGGVVMPEGLDAVARAERFVAFGRAAGPLMRSGVWSHGADMGTTDLDIQRIRHGAGLGPDPGPPGATLRARAVDDSSGSGAGLTVALSAEAVLEVLNMPLRGARIAIQGAGAVGRAAMKALALAGARVVAVSTVAGTMRDDNGLDINVVLDGLARQGDGFTGQADPARAVLMTPCDILLVCAGTASVSASDAGDLSAKAVVCGANIPFGEGAESVLESRGIAVVPDFVAGGGGVLGATLIAAANASLPELELIFRRHFKPIVAEALAQALSRGVPMAAVARQRALRTVEALDAAYGTDRAETLLPERLCAKVPAVSRVLLALERRTRGSTRLAPLGRRLHPLAIVRAERILGAALAAGAGAGL